MNVDHLKGKVEVGGRASRLSPAHGPVPLVSTGVRQPLHEAESKAAEVVGTLYRNEELITRFLSSRRLRESTEDTYRTALRSFTSLLGVPLEEAGRPELEEWYRRAYSRGLEASTILNYAYKLRALLEFSFTEKGRSRAEATERARAIVAGVPFSDLWREARRRTPGRDKLVAPEEMRILLETAVHPRARALVAVLEESACRKGELLSLRVRDVRRHETHMEIRVMGKTGERTIPLVRSVPALEAWLDAHPDPRPRAPLFATVVSGEIRRMSKHTPNKLMTDICERAGLRHIHPHMLRHTRLTELAAAGVGEYVLKSFAGWTPGSNMAEVYIHLSGRTHIPSILSLQGIVLEEAGQEVGA